MTATFKDILEKSKQELSESIEERKRTFRVNFTAEDFGELLKLEAKKILITRRSKNKELKIDDLNSNLINNLYLYFIRSPKCEYDLDKGIIVLGKVGCGKSLILEAYCNVWNKLCNRIIKVQKAREMAKNIINGDVYALYHAPLYIDDIGKEQNKTNNFGTEIAPLVEVLAERYDNGALTLATGNYNIATLTEHYGETITDRMEEMFTFVVLKGNSRRK